MPYNPFSEQEAQRLAAISVAAMSNTRETAKKNRLNQSSDFWSPAYEDVVRAVEREMELAERLATLEQAVAEARRLLNTAAWKGIG